ncbi:hypothetical protein AAE478_008233 [Parahypoxylon ruwenzoriense]
MINRGGRAGIPFRRNPPPPREPQPPTVTNTHNTHPEDVFKVKEILCKAKHLPLEIVDIILDEAEYWASSVATVDYSDHPFVVHGGRPLQENQFLLRTEPLGLTKWLPSSPDIWRKQAVPEQLKNEYPQSTLQELMDGPITTLEHPFRKVVFDIVSHDQGFGGDRSAYGTYRLSWTWFDAGLDRFDMALPESQEGQSQSIPSFVIRPIWPQPVADETFKPAMRYDHELLPNQNHLIQRNKLGEANWQRHHVEWSWRDDVDPDSSEAEELDAAGRGKATGNGEFVRDLKFGDMVTVWARSRFPGWSNYIQKAEVKVYWAV